MPLVDMQLIEGVIGGAEKRRMIEKVTDAMFPGRVGAGGRSRAGPPPR